MDIQKHRQKQQELMVRMVERRVRERAQQLYEDRGQIEGHALGDWVQAESEVLSNSIVEPLYRRLRNTDSEADEPAGDISSLESAACSTSA